MRKRMLGVLLVLAVLVSALASVAYATTVEDEREVTEAEVITTDGKTVKGSFVLDGITYYMGTLSGGMGYPLAEGQYETIYSSIEFYTSPNNGGSDGNAAEYLKVTDQDTLKAIYSAFNDTLKLEISPAKLVLDSGTRAAPKHWPIITESSNTDCQHTMRMGLKQDGAWYMEATGTINGETITSHSVLHWSPVTVVKEELELSELNQWLADCKADPMASYELTVTGKYEGNIVVPASFGDASISICGGEEGAELTGGITFLGGWTPHVEGIDFIGFGQNTASNGGYDNYALSGVGTFSNCTFTGYYHAVHCGESSSMLSTGTNSLFKLNYVAIYYNNTTATGGNPNLKENIFLLNGTALYFADLNNEYVPMTHFDIQNNIFWGNSTDVRNDEGRRLYMPGNYVTSAAEDETDPEPALIQADTQWVSAYPQLAQPSAVEVMTVDAAEPVTTADTGKYLFDLEDTPTISTAYSAQYPIPITSLPGKTITVMDADSEQAIFDFTDAVVAGTGSFAPSATLLEKDEGLELTINAPEGMTFEVRVPCDSSWLRAKVNFDGKTLQGVSVADGYVCFTVSNGGTFEIIPTLTTGDVLLGAVLTGSSASPLDDFTDLDAGAWYAEAVEYCLDEGLMSGTGDGKFSPSGGMTRAMVWTVLGRMSGETLNGTGANWYLDAQKWAVRTGVSDGTDPNGQITREELVTMLWRFAGSPKADTAVLQWYTDGASVSSWAREAMAWAVNASVVEGSNWNLTPGASALRCQVAAIFMRYHKFG